MDKPKPKHLIIILAFNFIVYGLCFLLISKRKNFSYISIRSSKLLFITNFSNLLINCVLVINCVIEISFITIFYYIFKFMMMISFFLRYERIIACYNMDNEDNYKMQAFTNKRHLIKERMFVRMLSILFVAAFIIIILVNIIGGNCFELLINSENENKVGKSCVWVLWNFIEQIILITYIFRIFNKRIKYYLSFEIYSLFIILFIYSNYTSFIFLYTDYYDLNFIYISLTLLYICLILNGFFPIFMSFFSKGNINYNFTPKLTNNLYLFLTNEFCYQAFNDYLIKKDRSGLFFLKLYTHIMKFKLDFALQKFTNRQLGLNEANEIFNSYFSMGNNGLITDQLVLQNVRDKCQILKINGCNQGMFDDGLQYAFNELNKRFSDFRNTKEFIELLDDINLYSFIQCKMVNIGLIKKF